MAVFARLSALFVVALVAVSASASVIEERTSGWGGGSGNACGKNEFSFKRGGKSCCLPSQPPAHPPLPPAQHECPKHGYYWHGTQKFCVPDHPVPDEDDDEPECPSNCKWNRNDQYCQPQTPPSHPQQPPSPPQQPPSPPKPSHGYGGGNHGAGGNNGHGGHGGNWKRDNKSRSIALCPNDLEACPISGLTGGEYECLDVQRELESCGGCASVGQGQDCTSIPGAWNVGCEAGACAVFTCKAGFIRSIDGKSCIAL